MNEPSSPDTFEFLCPLCHERGMLPVRLRSTPGKCPACQGGVVFFDPHAPRRVAPAAEPVSTPRPTVTIPDSEEPEKLAPAVEPESTPRPTKSKDGKRQQAATISRTTIGCVFLFMAGLSVLVTVLMILIVGAADPDPAPHSIHPVWLLLPLAALTALAACVMLFVGLLILRMYWTMGLLLLLPFVAGAGQWVWTSLTEQQAYIVSYRETGSNSDSDMQFSGSMWRQSTDEPAFDHFSTYGNTDVYIQFPQDGRIFHLQALTEEDAANYSVLVDQEEVVMDYEADVDGSVDLPIEESAGDDPPLYNSRWSSRVISHDESGSPVFVLRFHEGILQAITIDAPPEDVPDQIRLAANENGPFFGLPISQSDLFEQFGEPSHIYGENYRRIADLPTKRRLIADLLIPICLLVISTIAAIWLLKSAIQNDFRQRNGDRSSY